MCTEDLTNHSTGNVAFSQSPSRDHMCDQLHKRTQNGGRGAQGKHFIFNIDSFRLFRELVSIT